MFRLRTSLPLLLVILLWMLFAIYVWFTTAQLPERVATHFGVGGQPNGWMTRAGYWQFTLVVGLLVPAFMLGVFAIIGRGDDRWLNIPNKQYWLAPERRQETFDFMRRQGFWLAGFFIAFLTGIHHSILAANARSPVRLPAAEVGWIAGLYLAATLVWVAFFAGRFFRKST